AEGTNRSDLDRQACALLRASGLCGFAPLLALPGSSNPSLLDFSLLCIPLGLLCLDVSAKQECILSSGGEPQLFIQLPQRVVVAPSIQRKSRQFRPWTDKG